MFSSEKRQKIKSILYKLFDIDYEEKVSVIEEAEGKIILPEEYLERFTLYSLQSKDSLRGRENGLISLERAYDNWKIVHAPLLVVTNPGEGATSLLHASTYIYPTAKILESHEAIDTYTKLIKHLKKVLQIDEEFKNLKELKDYLVKSNEEHIIILENIERLFIRKINGFNLLEDFLLFLHATKQHIYWIISVNKYSFYYLNRVKFFASHFPYIINLNPLDDALLKEDILTRNKGYNLVYLKPEIITKKYENQLKKASKEERQKMLEDLFFKKLFDFAKGNISKAILYARNSAYNVKEKSVYIKPYQPNLIEDLKLSDLFILEAIFQHRSLTINELNTVLRNSNRQSRLTIEKLLEKEFIKTNQNTKGNTEYKINLMHLDGLKNRLRERLNRNIK